MHPLKPSTLSSVIEPSATLAVSARAGELKRAGKDVINLSSGEPDFAPPTAVRRTLASWGDGRPVHYTAVPGTPELRAAAAADLSRFHGRDISPEHILVSCGAKHSIVNLLLATLNPGDEVVIPAPYWVSYPDMVRLCGGVPVIATATAASRYCVTPDVLASTLTPRTKFVVLNSPSNPTGMGYSKANIRALGEVVAKLAPQAWFLCDDIYRELVYDDFTQVSPWQALQGVTEQIVNVDGVSKTYAMTGFRIGFLYAPPAILKAASTIQGQMTSGASTPAQDAAVTALTDATVRQEVATMREAFARRRHLVLGALSQVPGLRIPPPDGAFYVFVDATAYIGAHNHVHDDVTLATQLLDEALVATVPGSPFGAPGHLRLSYATSDEALTEACARLATALGRLQVHSHAS